MNKDEKEEEGGRDRALLPYKINTGIEPQDAFELGRTAAQRLQQQNTRLSLDLPMAIRTLFSDTELQTAMVLAGVVTHEPQALTPIASYQVTASFSSSSSNVPSYIVSRGSSSSTAATSQPSVVGSASPLESTHVEPKGGDKTNNKRKTRGTSRLSPIQTSHEREMEMADVSEEEEEEEEDDVCSAENVMQEKDASSTTRVSDSDYPKVSHPGEIFAGIHEDLPGAASNDCPSSCLSCETVLSPSNVNQDARLGNQLVLRDFLWLSLGMKTTYDRSCSVVPFCTGCLQRIQKLYNTCVALATLETEFNTIRHSLCEDIVAKNFRMTEMAKKSSVNVLSQSQHKEQLIHKMRSEYLQVLPGKRLLEQVSSYTNRKDDQESKDNEAPNHVPMPASQGSISNQRSAAQKLKLAHETSPQKSDLSPCNVLKESHPPTRSSPFRCVFCDKAFTRKNNLLDHLRRHRQFRPFECNNCGERYYTRQYANAHFLKQHPGEDPKLHIKRHPDPEALKSDISN